MRLGKSWELGKWVAWDRASLGAHPQGFYGLFSSDRTIPVLELPLGAAGGISGAGTGVGSVDRTRYLAFDQAVSQGK